MQARELMEPQLVGKLRAAGWHLPPTLKEDALLRVYDTRLDFSGCIACCQRWCRRATRF